MIRALPVDDIIEWDVNNWAQLITYWTPVLGTLPKTAKILAIGERNGGLSAWLAMLGFDVICSDREYPAGAQNRHSSMGLQGTITYRPFDIVHCDEQACQFDLIIAKSVIGGLKADPANRLTRNFQVQQKAVDNIHRLLKPGGFFLSAENMQGAAFFDKVRQALSKHKGWRYLSYAEMRSLFSAFEIKQLHAFGVLPTNFGSKQLNRFFYITNKYIFNFLPENYKYISFAVVQKPLTL